MYDLMTTVYQAEKENETKVMEKVIVIPNIYKDEDFSVLAKVTDKLLNSNCLVRIPEQYQAYEELSSYQFVSDQFIDDYDFAVVLGGDGTIISTSRKYKDYDIPLLGINIGNLGFLAALEWNEFINPNFVVGLEQFNVEERMMLGAYCSGTYMGTALNDIVISRQSLSRMISFDVFINDKFVNCYRADGVIISTPTGSTAYNLSAGGPIIVPTMNGMAITPICPHSLTARSMVLSGDDRVTVSLDKSRNQHVKDLIVTVDGQDKTDVNTDNKVMIQKDSRTTKLLRLKTNDFYKIVRKKLS